VVVVVEVDAEVLEDGGGEVGRADGFISDVATVGGGGAVDLASADTSTGDEGGEGVGPVVATGDGGRIVLDELADLGCAAEFTDDRDESVFEESPIVEVGEEGGEGAVEDGAEDVFEFGKVVVVGVPLRGRFVEAGFIFPIDGDEGDAGFDEASGEEEALSELGEAVTGTVFLRFGLKIEGGGDCVAFEEFEGLLGMIFEGADARIGEVAKRGLDFGEKRVPILEAGFFGIVHESEALHFEVLPAGVAFDEHGIELFTHAASGLSGDAICLADEMGPGGEDDGGGDASGGGEISSGECGEGRPVFGSGFISDWGAEVFATGVHFTAGRAVDGHTVRHRPEEAELVHLIGEKGEVFANLDAGDVGGDGFEFATDFGGSIGLHVPEVDVTGAAEEEDEDAGFCALFGRGGL